MNYTSLQQPLGIGGAVTLLLCLATTALFGADSQLAPIRITPERRQLIGLKFATVVRKYVSDRLETTGNIEAAKAVGRAIAERAKAKGIDKVAFDRSGFMYHGRVKALAEAAREAGLEF